MRNFTRTAAASSGACLVRAVMNVSPCRGLRFAMSTIRARNDVQPLIWLVNIVEHFTSSVSGRLARVNGLHALIIRKFEAFTSTSLHLLGNDGTILLKSL
ncbi:hypothetical protein D3C77_636310 [compost metagenome]